MIVNKADILLFNHRTVFICNTNYTN